MLAIILSAGKGKRMGESSNHTPKPLLKYNDKTLLEHKLDSLPDSVTEVIITIGHLGRMIAASIGYQYKKPDGTSLAITYIEQNELLGTAHSLWQAKDFIQQNNQPFLVLMGDDLYSKEDLLQMTEVYKNNPDSWVALVNTQPEHFIYGKCIIEDGLLKGFVNDHDHNIPENIIYTGACLLTTEIFNLPMAKVNSTEYGLPQTFIQTAETHPIYIVQATFWRRITSPEDLGS